MKTTEKTVTPEKLTELYTALVLLTLPLIVHNAYFDITLTKVRLYTWLTGAYLLTLTVLLIARREKPRFSARLWLFWGFLLPFILSTAFCDGRGAWIGTDNRYQGICTALLYALSALGVCAFGRITRRNLAALLWGFALCSALASAYILGWDVFGFVGRLSFSDRYRFISTIGNVDFMAAYCVLLLPVTAALAISERERGRRTVLSALSVLGVWAALATRCDSAVLGMAAALVLMPLLLRDTEALRRFPLTLPVLSAAVGAYAGLCGRLSELARVLARPASLLAPGAAGFALWLLLRRREDGEIRKLRRLYGYGVSALLVLFLIFLVLANTLLSAKLSGFAAQYFRLDGDWGSDRGMIWRSFAEQYRQFPPLRKLIGGGAGCVAAWDREHRLFADAVTDAAHNEYLHYLLTNGMVGLISYLLFLVLSVREAAKRGGAAAALGCGCAAYAVQAAVNIAQPFTTPLFFVLLFLSAAPDETGERDGRRTWERAMPVLLAALLLLYGAVNGAPRPEPVFPTETELRHTGDEAEIFYTIHDTPLYSSVGGREIASVPPHTPLPVLDAAGGWLKVLFEGKTLWCRSP